MRVIGFLMLGLVLQACGASQSAVSGQEDGRSAADLQKKTAAENSFLEEMDKIGFEIEDDSKENFDSIVEFMEIYEKNKAVFRSQLGKLAYGRRATVKPSDRSGLVLRTKEVADYTYYGATTHVAVVELRLNTRDGMTVKEIFRLLELGQLANQGIGNFHFQVEGSMLGPSFSEFGHVASTIKTTISRLIELRVTGMVIHGPDNGLRYHPAWPKLDVQSSDFYEQYLILENADFDY